MANPEQLARAQMDHLLEQAGWLVCDVKDAVEGRSFETGEQLLQRILETRRARHQRLWPSLILGHPPTTVRVY